MCLQIFMLVSKVRNPPYSLRKPRDYPGNIRAQKIISLFRRNLRYGLLQNTGSRLLESTENKWVADKRVESVAFANGILWCETMFYHFPDR